MSWFLFFFSSRELLFICYITYEMVCMKVNTHTNTSPHIPSFLSCQAKAHNILFSLKPYIYHLICLYNLHLWLSSLPNKHFTKLNRRNVEKLSIERESGRETKRETEQICGIWPHLGIKKYANLIIMSISKCWSRKMSNLFAERHKKSNNKQVCGLQTMLDDRSKRK